MLGKKVTVIGYFAFERGAEGDRKMFGGQTAKCRSLVAHLKTEHAENEIATVDTYRWKARPLPLLLDCLRKLRGSDVVLMALSENGLGFFMPLLLHLKKIYGFKLGYVVIGGWISDRCRSSKRLLKLLKRLDSVFAETVPMAEELRDLGIEKVEFAPNGKDLEIADRADATDLLSVPYTLGTFSRVSKEKGIADAIEAVTWVNSQKPSLCRLRIFGPIAPEFKEEFEELIKTHTESVEYCGSVPSDESSEAVGSLLLLLFPTRWYDEGFPGTILDAFASGVPVLASDWKNARSIICDGETGFICEFGNNNSFKEKLLACLDNPRELIAMRQKCLQEAEKYLPGNAFAPIDCFIARTD